MKWRKVLPVVVTVGAIAAGIQVVSVSTSNAAGPSDLNSADLQKIQKNGYVLSTKAGTHVRAIKGQGKDVWEHFNPDVRNPDTDEIKTHDLIVVRSTGNVPQSTGVLPGSTDAPPRIVAVSMIIDASDGRVLEISEDSATGPKGPDPADLGTPTDVQLKSVTPPKRSS